MKRNEEPIIIEETFEKDCESVWGAITETEQMRKWFFENIPVFKPVIGFEVEFDVDTGERNFIHQWKITNVIPKKIIEYNWRYDGYSGDSFVTFELKQEEDSTKLRLTHMVTEDFTEDVPEFKRESCLAGWRYFIKQRLKEYMKQVQSST